MQNYLPISTVSLLALKMKMKTIMRKSKSSYSDESKKQNYSIFLKFFICAAFESIKLSLLTDKLLASLSKLAFYTLAFWQLKA